MKHTGVAPPGAAPLSFQTGEQNMTQAALKETGALILTWEDASPWRDGFGFIGPFPNEETAADAASRYVGGEWAGASIYAPKGVDIGSADHADGDRLIVVRGDVFDGFKAFGPFKTVKAAGAWAAKYDDSIVVEMLRIEDYDDEELAGELADA
jgi:hypothetical protein